MSTAAHTAAVPAAGGRGPRGGGGGGGEEGDARGEGADLLGPGQGGPGVRSRASGGMSLVGWGWLVE